MKFDFDITLVHPVEIQINNDGKKPAEKNIQQSWTINW